MQRIEIRVALYLLLLFVTAKLAGLATGALAQVAPPSPPEAADAAPAAVFDLADYGATVYSQRCSNCHAIKSGEPSLAPPLHDVLGRRAGSVAGYTYSFKLDGSNLVWNAATLNDWLAQATIATPDIRFRHAGLNDAIQREAVVAYIMAQNGK